MDAYSSMTNGVKARSDGKGDGWALAHRNLGRTFNMHDLDAVFGFVAFGHNTGEKLFLEYVPDSYENRNQPVRKFAAVAMFDRKSTEDAALDPRNTLSVAQYLWQCRTLGEGNRQPVMPKFFLVIGGQEPPWRMVEIDIYTGERTGTEQILRDVSAKSWREMWDCLGLSGIRNQLRGWIDPPNR